MPAGEEFDARPVRAFLPGPDAHVDELVWPASVPAMACATRIRISGICSPGHDTIYDRGGS
jgi:hypothetical protein